MTPVACSTGFSHGGHSLLAVRLIGLTGAKPDVPADLRDQFPAAGRWN